MVFYILNRKKKFRYLQLASQITGLESFFNFFFVNVLETKPKKTIYNNVCKKIMKIFTKWTIIVKNYISQVANTIRRHFISSKDINLIF